MDLVDAVSVGLIDRKPRKHFWMKRAKQPKTLHSECPRSPLYSEEVEVHLAFVNSLGGD